MEFEQHLPRDTAMDTDPIEETIQGFWEDLKEKLDNDLTEEELRRIILLMKDKVGKGALERFEIEHPSDLLNILENNMLIEDALSTVQHVFTIMDHCPEHAEKSFGQIIKDHMNARKRFGCANIIGRENEICEAIKKLNSSDYKGLWIHGFGGLGKTMLANEICARLFYSQNRNILRVDLKQVTSIDEFLRRLLAKFTIYITPSDTQGLTAELLRHIRNSPQDTCILLDNIEDVYQSKAEEVNQILHGCQHMPIKWIVTSRLPMDCIEGIEQLELQPLQRRSAEKLLKLSLRPIKLTETQCKILLDMTCENPLAIRLLSSAVKDNDLNDVSDNLLKPLLNEQVLNGMKSCIEFSCRSLKETEICQLYLLSVVETTQFDIGVVKAVLEIGEEEALFLMMKLTNRQIVQRVYTAQKDVQYCLHPLIYEYVQNLPEHGQFSMQAQNNFCKHMIERIEQAIENADKNYTEAIANISGNQPLLKAFFRVLSLRKNDGNNLLMNNRNMYLSKLQEMLQMTQTEKEQLYRSLIRQMKSNGRQHSLVFWKLEQIQMMIDNERFHEAEQEISMTEKTLDEIPDNESGTFLKGRFWFVKGRFLRLKHVKQSFDARKCFEKSLYFFRNIANVPDAAKALNGIGNAYFDLRDLEKALIHHKEAEDTFRQFSSDNIHPDISMYEFNVGTIYLAKARHELSINRCVTKDARTYFKQALEIFENSMAKDVLMGSERMLQYAKKLTQKAVALFHLNKAPEQNSNSSCHLQTSLRCECEEAINDMKKALEIEIAPFTEPDQKVTLAYYKTGETFIHWREEFLVGSLTAKRLLKEALICFRGAEEAIKSDCRASLTDGKSDFISMYKQIGSPSMVTRKEAESIKKFCELYESGEICNSSASSESISGSDAESIHSGGNSDNDDITDTTDCLDGIPSAEAEKQDAMEFEQGFFSKIDTQLTDAKNKKRRYSETD